MNNFISDRQKPKALASLLSRQHPELVRFAFNFKKYSGSWVEVTKGFAHTFGISL